MNLQQVMDDMKTVVTHYRNAGYGIFLVGLFVGAGIAYFL